MTNIIKRRKYYHPLYIYEHKAMKTKYEIIFGFCYYILSGTFVNIYNFKIKSK